MPLDDPSKNPVAGAVSGHQKKASLTMPEQFKCPKCGAELHNTHKERGRIKELWRCWSFRYDGGVFVQTDQCRIRELTAENAKLRTDLDGYASALDTQHAELERLTAEVERLQSAIRSHRDQRGDDRCWLDDETLYKVLPEGYAPPARDTAVEIANCQKFIETRRCPAIEYVSPQRRIEELTAENERLTADLAAHKTLLDWSFGLPLNANDLFGYACADCIYLDNLLYDDAIAAIKKHGSAGLIAIMARIASEDKPIRPKDNWEAAKEDAAKIPDDTVKLSERWRAVEAMAKVAAENERLRAEVEELRKFPKAFWRSVVNISSKNSESGDVLHELIKSIEALSQKGGEA